MMGQTRAGSPVAAAESVRAKLIHVIGNEILSPIVESQVYRPLAAQASREGAEGMVVAVLPLGYLLRSRLRRAVGDLLQRYLEQYGISTRIVYGGTSRLRARAWEVASLRHCLRKALPSRKGSVVLGRNCQAASLVLDAVAGLKHAPQTVFDCRGDEPFEVVGTLGGGWDPQNWSQKVKEAFDLEQRQQSRACQADRIIAVSEIMAKVLHERHGADLAKVTLKPCAVDLAVFPPPDKQAARKLLGFDDRLVVSYLGSLAWYQLPDQGIRLFKLIKQHRPEALFLGITTEPERLMAMLAEAGLGAGDFKVISVPSKDVAKYLPAADLGLLLREANPVNAVASPVKFAEYLACGLPVLVTTGIGDYSSIVEKERLGGVVDIHDDDQTLSAALSGILQRLDADGQSGGRARRFAEETLNLAPKQP
jgi:glycosyltransferase involved in cell wall biosynthesis